MRWACELKIFWTRGRTGRNVWTQTWQLNDWWWLKLRDLELSIAGRRRRMYRTCLYFRWDGGTRSIMSGEKKSMSAYLYLSSASQIHREGEVPFKGCFVSSIAIVSSLHVGCRCCLSRRLSAEWFSCVTGGLEWWPLEQSKLRCSACRVLNIAILHRIIKPVVSHLCDSKFV